MFTNLSGQMIWHFPPLTFVKINLQIVVSGAIFILIGCFFYYAFKALPEVALIAWLMSLNFVAILAFSLFLSRIYKL